VSTTLPTFPAVTSAMASASRSKGLRGYQVVDVEAALGPPPGQLWDHLLRVRVPLDRGAHDLARLQQVSAYMPRKVRP
jgi:hypothetical protein